MRKYTSPSGAALKRTFGQRSYKRSREVIRDRPRLVLSSFDHSEGLGVEVLAVAPLSADLVAEQRSSRLRAGSIQPLRLTH